MTHSAYKPIAQSNHFIILDKYIKECKIAERYQSESDLERELVQDLVNQGYEFLPDLTTPKAIRILPRPTAELPQTREGRDSNII